MGVRGRWEPRRELKMIVRLRAAASVHARFLCVLHQGATVALSGSHATEPAGPDAASHAVVSMVRWDTACVWVRKKSHKPRCEDTVRVWATASASAAVYMSVV